MKLLFSDAALTDLLDIKAYYLEKGVPQVSQEQISTVLSKTENLLRHPEMGRVVPEFSEPNIRELIVNPYRVVYLHSKDYIQVIRVWRSERLMKPITTD